MNRMHKRGEEPLACDDIETLLDEVCPPGDTGSQRLRAIGRTLAATDLSGQSRIRHTLRARLVTRTAHLPRGGSALRHTLGGAALLLALLLGGAGLLSPSGLALARTHMLQLFVQPATVTVVPTPSITPGITVVATLPPTPIPASARPPAGPAPSPVAGQLLADSVGAASLPRLISFDSAWRASTPAPRLLRR